MRCYSLSSFCLVLIVSTVLFDVCMQEGITVENLFRFPYGSNSMGIFTAIAVPIDLNGPADVFFTAAIEAIYAMPSNESKFVYPPIINSTSARQFVYDLIERKIDSYGYPGKECLLRAICEASEHTIHASGVLGDILHIFLTPISGTVAVFLSLVHYLLVLCFYCDIAYMDFPMNINSPNLVVYANQQKTIIQVNNTLMKRNR